MQPDAAPWGPPPSVPPPPPRPGPQGWYQDADGGWRPSATPPAPGWWLASDLRWYPPELADGGRGDQEDQRRWGLGDVAWGFLVFAIGSLAVGILIVVGVAAVRGDWPDDDELGPYAISFGILANVAAFGVVPWIASRRKGSGSLARDFGLSFRAVDLPIGIGIGIGALIVAGLVSGALTALLDPSDETTNVPVDDLSGPGQILVFALAVAVITPVIEELFFRGLLSRSLAKRGVHPLTNGVVTTLVFVLPHLLSQPQWPNVAILFAAITCFGTAFHVAALVTGGRLGAPIVAHVVVNGVAVLALALA